MTRTVPYAIDLYGPLRVRAGDTAVPLGPPRQRALLAVLLLRPGAVTTADQLAAALWGDRHPAYVKNLLQKWVSGLRGALGDAVELSWAGDGYLLDTGGAVVDVVAYEQLAAEGTAAATRGELARAAQLLDEGRALVKGPLVEGLEGPLLELERMYRKERFLADIELRAEIELDLGGHRNAVPYLQRIVTKHPLRERFVWLLMLGLYRAGRGAQALGVYAEYRRQVGEELGADPGPELKVLHAQLLRQDPELAELVTLSVPAGA